MVLASIVFQIPGSDTAVAAPTTFNVTSSSCSGPGSLGQAILDANANPGVDTIEIQPGLVINGQFPSCGGSSLTDAFVGTFTESARVIGNGARVQGINRWVSPGGNPTPPVGPLCPGSAFYKVSQAGRLFAIGEASDVDNSGVEVTVDGLDAQGLGGLFVVRKGAGLEVTNSSYAYIWDLMDYACDRPAVYVLEEATFTARNTDFANTFSTEDSWVKHIPAPPTALISGFYATINLDHVVATAGQRGYFIHNMFGTTKVVSSLMLGAGGLYNGPGASMDIVNSAWLGRSNNFTGQTNQIHNRGTMRVQASTYWVADTDDCDRPSATELYLCPGGAAPLLGEQGTISLEGTAVGTHPGGVDPAGFSAPVVSAVPGSTILSDEFTWVGPTSTAAGSAAAIAALLPNALTGSPGLNGLSPVFDDQGNGELIDRIDCAANPLVNPIDSTPISTDVFGNQRCDGNGLRDIGAVQLQLVPHLTIIDVGDGQIELSWTHPDGPGGPTITGYRIYRRPLNGPWSPPIDIAGSTSLGHVDTGLDNGTNYEYRVTVNYGGSESPDSNIVDATPVGPVSTPNVVATAQAGGQVDVTWGLPDWGGHAVGSFAIKYREQGAATWHNWGSVPDAGNVPQVAQVTGLCPGVTYEFGVIATSPDGAAGDRGTATAQLDPHDTACSPLVTVTDTSDSTVGLAWTQVPDPGSGPITGYRVSYRPTGTANWTALPLVDGAGTLATSVGDLTNGTTYQFQVESWNGSAGPPSPAVTATPFGPIGTPAVTATPGNGQATPSWTQPSTGGHTIDSYSIRWRPVGTSGWTTRVQRASSALETTIGGLDNGTEYEFQVAAHGVNNLLGPYGATTATPQGPPTTTTQPPTTTTIVVPPTLPETGSRSEPLGIAGMIILLFGGLMMAISRRGTVA